MESKPNPGTAEAIKAGCLCPVIDNHYGKGYRGEAGVYIYSEACHIHRRTRDDDSKKGADRRSA